MFGQLTGGVVKEGWRIHQPLKVLRNLILTSDLENISLELGLPHVLFDIVRDSVENTNLIKVIAQEQNYIQQCIIPLTVFIDFLCTFILLATVECASTWRNYICAHDLLGEAL